VGEDINSILALILHVTCIFTVWKVTQSRWRVFTARYELGGLFP
jgi:hypothetical protein